jgi:hypothetical protein
MTAQFLYPASYTKKERKEYDLITIREEEGRKVSADNQVCLDI